MDDIPEIPDESHVRNHAANKRMQLAKERLSFFRKSEFCIPVSGLGIAVITGFPVFFVMFFDPLALLGWVGAAYFRNARILATMLSLFWSLIIAGVVCNNLYIPCGALPYIERILVGLWVTHSAINLWPPIKKRIVQFRKSTKSGIN